MNELQLKLARRRKINEEDEASKISTQNRTDNHSQMVQIDNPKDPVDIKADPSCKLEKDPICRLFTSSDFLEDCFPNEQSTFDISSNSLVKQPTSSSTDNFDTSMISDKGEVGVLSSLTLSENGGEYQNSEISSSYNIGVNELKTEAGNLIPALGLEFASFVNESFPSVLNLNAIERVIVEEVMAYLLKNLEIDNRKGTEVEAFPLPIVSNPSKSDYQNDVSLHCSSCPVNQDTDDNSQVNSIPDEDSKSATLLNNDEELPDNLQLDEALPFLSDTGEKAATANDLLFPESSRASSVATETTQERESDPILAKFTDPSSNREAESRLNTSRPSSREISLESDSQKFHGKSHWFSLKVSKPHWMKNFIQSKRSKNLPVDAEVARAMFDDFMKAEGDLLHSEAARQSDSEAVFARLQQLQEENDKLAAEVASLKEQLQERDAVIQRLRRTVTENARPTLGQIIGSMGDAGEIEEAEGEEGSFFHDYDEAVTPSSRYKRKSYVNNYGRNIISVDLEAEMEGIFGSEKLNSQLDRERSAGTKSSSPLPPTDETFQELFAPMDSPTARATASSNTSAHLSADVLVRAFANTVSDSSYRDRGGDFDRLSTNETANSPSPSSKIVSNGAELSYEEFMFKFLRCKDLLAITRIFVLSVLGPKGDYSTPPSGRSAAGYKFFGLLRLEERCKEFFEDMHRRMKEHKEWQSRLISGRDMDEERWLSARDRLEQYVMDQIGEGAFRSVQSDEEDRLLLRQMKLLSFLTPEALDISTDLLDEDLLSTAMDELRRIADYRSPAEKVSCVEKCASVIFKILNLSRLKEGSSSSPAGADDFLPLFIWVVLRSQIPQLYSNCAFIHAFLSPVRLMGKAGYCLINLESAIAFLTYITPSSVNLDPLEFERNMAEAEKALQ